MIIEFFCNAFFALARFLIGLFPRFPSFNISVSFDPFFYLLEMTNNFIPLPLVAKCCLLVLVVYNIKFVWSILMWLIRKIPGVS